MIRKLISAIFFGIIFLQSQGQITFQKTFGGNDSDFGKSVDQTFDGGYILAGAKGYFQNVVIKTDANGDTIWTKTIGYVNTGFSNYNQCIRQVNDSGYILLTNSDSLFRPNSTEHPQSPIPIPLSPFSLLLSA